MPRIESLIESQAADLSLSDQEAAALVAAGRRLASDRGWFGEKAPEDRTVIRCVPIIPGRWSVRVQDAVGVVSVGDLQIVVRPKIPTPHLLHLFSKALQVPRLEDQPGLVQAAAALWELVARWFIRSTFTVLRRDLSRDYQHCNEALQMVRGRIDCVPTARSYYAGRVELHCGFDDFTVDTSLNRLIRAAAREVSRSSLLSQAVRRDAFRIVARLEDVGELRSGDLAASVERRTWYYRDAVTLARHIMRCVGRTFAAGNEAAWTFLIRTPELVEAGIRQTLMEQIGPTEQIQKLAAPIVGSTLGVHPDLVFGSGWGVADVKYKLTDGNWYRPDLYEVVAFAAAFRSTAAALICFANRKISASTVGLGDIRVSQLTWNCALDPNAASAELGTAVRSWITEPDRLQIDH